jgi:ATP-dependent exoDNAse (exonuclease V) beta subunit
MKSPLADQAARDRFVTELDTNFCVSASAGAGKTTAIVSRIVELARREEELIVGGGESRLSRLVVVTYGVLAAEELRVRARQRMFQELSGDAAKRQLVLAEFSRAYFGTIHSFCLKLLKEEGRHLGLPADLELLDETDDRLWQRFAESDFQFPKELSRTNIERVFRHYSFEEILSLAKQMKPDDAERIARAGKHPPMPELDCREVLGFVPGKRVEKSVREHQERLQRWLDNLRGDEGYLELPECTSGGEEFKTLFREAFAPYVGWLNEQASLLAAQVNLYYRDYRVEQGCLTYHDMIVWAKKLLDEPKILRRLRERNYVVILDEAQDTDPAMFMILTELTRPVEAEVYAWPRETSSLAPLAGSFCFVGDDQQMIYSDRADLRKYHQYIDAFRQQRGGDELDFSVTMRCPRFVIQAVNDIFPKRLDQPLVKFKPLMARPEVGEGQVRILPLAPFAGSKVDEQFVEECWQVLDWLKAQGFANLGISDWSELAVLAPRVGWLSAAANLFREAGLPVRVISSKDRRADMPAYSWPLALLHVLMMPRDRFELIGVLREVYGVSDAELLEVHRAVQGLDLFSEPKGFERSVRALQQLRSLRERLLASQRLGLFARELIEETCLAERIQAANGEPEFLQDFVRSALAAEMDGLDVLAWLELLKRDLEKEPPQAVAGANEIQFLTCQKAKGLEWPVVLALGFGRKIGFKTPTYPRMEKSGERLQIHFNGLTKDEESKNAAESARDEELQRLFYVMMTRAKRMLVIPDSSALYGKGDPKFADLLRWEEVKLDDLGKAEAIAVKPDANGETAGDFAVSVDLKAAVEVARRIPQRILPHKLAVHAEPEEEREFAQEILVGGLEYGTWWHGVLQYFPWTSPLASQESYMREQIESSPLACRERGRKELGLFLRSELRQALCADGVNFLAELPFSTLMAKDQAMEGVIDLVVVNRDGRCVVVDWKTNRQLAGESPEQFAARLDEIYRRQLAAYAELLSKQFGREIGGCYLYATVSGLKISIDTA